MNTKKILLSFSILLFSLTCDESTLPKDCKGDEGGIAYYDDCGVCDADPNNDNLFPPTNEATDSTELVIGCIDCTGTVGGIHWYDECDVCGGDNSACSDCAGVPNGDSLVDMCGTCDTDSLNDCLMDCNNTWGGTAINDDCGVCEGDNSSCSDCAGTPNGNLLGTGVDGIGNDCAGQCGGSAIIDSCDVCGGDDTSCLTGCTNESACNYSPTVDPSNDDGSCTFSAQNYDCDGNCTAEFDCNNECGGDASIDCSGECSGGNTGIIAYTICGCFDTSAGNFYCHLDASDCYNNPSVDTCCENNTSIDESCNSNCIYSPNTGSQYSNPFIDSEECEYQVSPIEFNTGCVDSYENPNYGLVFNDTSLCEYYGCTDTNATNYNDYSTNCIDGSDLCCTYAEVTLSFGNITNSTIEIYMENTESVGGFQFDLTGGSSLTGTASGGSAEDNGFSVSSGGTLVFGVSFEGNSIPIGSGLLTIVNTSNVNEPICIENLIISDATGQNLIVHSTPVCSE